MIKQIKRRDARAGSIKILQRRITYIENSNDPDHKGLVVYPSVNYNCASTTGQGFLEQCLKADELYRSSPQRHKGGRPSPRLFEEFIYSTPEGAHLNEMERKQTELTLVNTFARHSAVRLSWHVNETSGRCDLHLLVAAKNDDWPASLTISSQFGNGKAHIIATINRVSKAIIKSLNKTRPKKLKSAMEIHKERIGELTGKKKPTLALELAELGLAPDELRKSIEQLGYSVTRENETTISVKFPGGKRAHRYNKADLIKEIAEVPEKEITIETPVVTPVVTKKTPWIAPPQNWKKKKWKELDGPQIK